MSLLASVDLSGASLRFYSSLSAAIDGLSSDSRSDQEPNPILLKPVSGINKLKDDSNFVFYEIPSGKPDPEAPCTIDTLRKDSRVRVDQSETKGDNAFYYACNMLRHRIGKYPTLELKGLQKIEQTCSKKRKFLCDYSLSEMKELNDRVSKGRPTVTKKDARLMLDPHFQNFYFSSRGCSESQRIRQIEFVEDFLNSNTSHLSEYLSHYVSNQRFKEGQLFLKMFNSSQEELLNLMRSIDPVNYNHWYQRRTWDLLSSEEQLQLLDRFSELTMADLYGFESGTWDPKTSFKDFIKELRKRGPMVVNGVFGRNCYNENPFFQIHPDLKQEMLGWHKGTRNGSVKRHSIVVVGAEMRDGKEYVYYLDPNDASKHDAPRRVYMISYESLKNNALSHFSDKMPVKVSKAGYTWCRKVAKN